MVAEKHWQLIGSDGQQYGPYQAEQLAVYARDGTVTPETMVWTAGLEEWIPASRVEGLFPNKTSRPALLTGVTQAPRQAVMAQALPPWGMETARPLDKGYETVSWGLRLVFLGVLINFFGEFAYTVMENTADPPQDYGIIAVAIVGGYLLEILGVSLCFSRPCDAKARTFLGFSIGFMVLPIGLLLGLPFLNSFEMALFYLPFLFFSRVFANLLAMVFFVLYLKHLSACMANRSLDLSLRSFLRYLSITIGLSALTGAGLAIMVGGAATAGGLGALMFFGGILAVNAGLTIIAVLYLVAFFWFLRVLQRVRQAINWQRNLAEKDSPPSAKTES